MAYSDQEWEKVKAFYERGLSLAEIISNPKISIKSKSQISKRAAKDGWQKETEKKRLVEKEIETKQNLAFILEQKETMSAIELDIHNDLVSEKIQIASAISKFAVRAVAKAGVLLDVTESGSDFKAIVEGVDKLSITTNINERHAKPSVINNSNNSGAQLSQMTDDDLMRELTIVRERTAAIIGQ